MTEEIKEILDIEKYRNKDGYVENINLLPDEIHKLLDYITNLQQAIEIKNQRIKEEQQEKERYMKFYNGLNKWNKELQQDLDKAIDTIEKDRQFYKCRMDEYVELKKENEELNKMCELYSKSLYNAELTDYKSRLEKASNKLDSMFANGEENKILDDLLELDKIVKGDKQ